MILLFYCSCLKIFPALVSIRNLFQKYKQMILKLWMLDIFVLFVKCFSLNLDAIMLLTNYEVVVVINYIIL